MNILLGVFQLPRALARGKGFAFERALAQVLIFKLGLKPNVVDLRVSRGPSIVFESLIFSFQSSDRFRSWVVSTWPNWL